MNTNPSTTTGIRDASSIIGRTLTSRDGETIGTVEELYTDTDTGQPEWIAVKTGWFGSRVSFVPLEGIDDRNGELCASYDKATVRDAPTVEADGRLTPDEEELLYRHYGRDYANETTGTVAGLGEPMRDDAMSGEPMRDDAMTRSEEELQVSRTRREAGRARLRKWVETEHVTQTVPVSRDEIRVEREPITEGNVDEAVSGPAFRESVHEEVLYEDDVRAEKQAVPKERVRLTKETVTEEQQVGADLRKEHIELENDTDAYETRPDLQ